MARTSTALEVSHTVSTSPLSRPAASAAFPSLGKEPVAYLMTARGRGAVATIRLEGAGATEQFIRSDLFQPLNSLDLRSASVHRVIYGVWGSELPEDVVVVRVGDDAWEVHGHGGRTAPERIVNDLGVHGFRRADSIEARIQRSSRMVVELQQAVEQATTVRTLGWLLRQLDAWPVSLAWLRSRLDRIEAETRDWDAIEAVVQSTLRWSAFGQHLLEPHQIVLLGRPNAGKSSLINALLGYARSIVNETPGTTRDVVTSEAVFDGWPVQLSDTAGLRDATDELEQRGIDRARSRIRSADLLLLVIDRSVPPTSEDQTLLNEWPEARIIAHKADLKDAWGDRFPRRALEVSSVSGAGLEALMSEIVQSLVPEEPSLDQLLVVLPRHEHCLRKLQAAIACRDAAAARQAVDELQNG